MSGSLSLKLTPGDQSRKWKRRWTEINRNVDELMQPHTDTLSGEVIHAAQQDLERPLD